MSEAAVRKKRPVYLDLVAIRLPLPGFVSILHRISGAFLFVAVVWLLFVLDRSLASESGFAAASRYLQLWPVKLGLLAIVWAYCHHFGAGIRLTWQCRRGLLELDLVPERFLQQEAANLTDEELARLGELLGTEDNELWDIVNGRSQRFDSRHHNLIERLRAA